MKIKKRTSRKSSQSKLTETEAKLKRALADYDNLEKRVCGQREEFVKFAKAEIIDKLVAVLDDLERAERHLKNKGLAMAVDQFQAVLSSEGVKEMETIGKIFNPETMDCVGMVKGQKNRVVKVLQKGYFLNSKIVRPAKVEVGRGK